MNAFDVLADPVRRRILELLSDGEQAAGAVTVGVPGEVPLPGLDGVHLVTSLAEVDLAYLARLVDHR